MAEISKESPHTKMARAEFVRAEKETEEAPAVRSPAGLGGECLGGGGENAAASMK